MKYVCALAVLFAGVLAVLGCCGCTAPEEILRYDPQSSEPVQIGVLLPLTGADAARGKKMLNGARFAADELNSRRGHFGRQVDLVVMDTNSTPEGAAKAFKAAVEAGVVGVIGGYSTLETRGLAPFAKRFRVPLVTIMATGNDEMIGSNEFVFRSVFTDKQQSEMLAGFMKYYRRVKRLVIVVSSDPLDVYSRNVARDTAEAFRKLGGEVACVCEISKENPEKSLREAASFVPDAILLPFEAKTAASYYRKLRNIGFAGNICGPDTWDEPVFFQTLNGVKNLGNSFYTSCFSNDARHIEYTRFRESFRKKRYYYPGSFETQTFDAINMLLIGFGNNGNNLRRFRKNWMGMRKHAGASAIYTMKPGNVIDRTIYIKRVGRSIEQGILVPKTIAGLQYSRLKDYAVGDE